MADSEETAAILKRALGYPYATPDRSYLYLDGEARELPEGALDLTDRTPLLSYGANSAPEALARKLAALPGVEMPVVQSQLEGFDVVYSAHVSPYGAVPATLHESPGTTAPVFVLHPTPEQRTLLTASEPNYDLVEVDGIAAYRSKHGCLRLDGSPVALAAVRSEGRTLPELDEPAVLDRVRAHVEPDADIETFIRRCVEWGGIKPLPRLGPV
ncbi:MAG TPA: hypothetical protein VNC16_09390 [Solirubrobacterales bacterium]|jgi:hypothetical protein|nr:hypothetical protein [Solirubrobacterales bacterium]